MYKNLHREKRGLQDCWSVKARVDGRWLVVHHAADITLGDVVFRYSEATRQKVITRKSRIVHCWVTGVVTGQPSGLQGFSAFSYNPYKNPHFFDKATGAEVKEAEVIRMRFCDRKAFYNLREL